MCRVTVYIPVITCLSIVTIAFLCILVFMCLNPVRCKGLFYFDGCILSERNTFSKINDYRIINRLAKRREID